MKDFTVSELTLISESLHSQLNEEINGIANAGPGEYANKLLRKANHLLDLATRFDNALKDRKGECSTPGMKQQPGEIWYHVVYADKSGEQHNEVYFFYRPQCNFREEPVHELGRWLTRNIDKVSGILDYYMEDHAGNRVEW